MSTSIELSDMDGNKTAQAVESGVIVGPQQLPNRWFYRRRRFGFVTFPYYASPEIQLLMVALICFLLPGMYNAMSGVGAAGQVDSHYFDNATAALYGTFSFTAFFSGSIVNRVGIRYTLVAGGLGYTLFSGSLLHYNKHPSHKSGVFEVLAGALLGASAGLLWAAQGTIMVSYPPEHQKGRYISVFWCLFNLGAVIGSFPAIAWNIHDDTSAAVSNNTYITFIVLMTVGCALGFCMLNAEHVRRSDGSRVHLALHPTWRSEFVGLWTTLNTDKYVVLLFPMFFASNLFYTYQYNGYNQAHFDLRTRTFNNLFYWVSQIFGAITFGVVIDKVRVPRALKAKGAWVVLLILTIVVWGGGYAYQKSVPDRINGQQANLPLLDWSSSRYGGPLVLYMVYGFFDAFWQSTVYWYMGALTNSGRTSANFVGFYKAFQSVGAAIMWRLDAVKKPFMVEFIVTWCMLAGALVIAAPVIFRVINNTNPYAAYDGQEEYGDNNNGGDVSNAQPTTASQVPPTASDTAPAPVDSNVVAPLRPALVPRDELAMSGSTLRARDRPETNRLSVAEAIMETEREAEAFQASQSSPPRTPPNRRRSFLPDYLRRD